MNDSNLFLASKEIDLDEIDFGDQANNNSKSIFLKKINFIFDKSIVEDEIQILWLKRKRNRLSMRVKSTTGSIYNILDKECEQVIFLDKKYSVKSFKIKADICDLKLHY